MLHKLTYLVVITVLFGLSLSMKPLDAKKEFAVIAYYAGNGEDLNNYDWEKITHVIFSFCHLEGQELKVDNAKDSLTIRNLANLKHKYRHLKVLLSLGGWGGCETCSPVFAQQEGRAVFSQSVKELMNTYHMDGIDLDWEYPAVEGFPGHQYMPQDKQNFTALVSELRRVLGQKAIISFAAGGFDSYFQRAIEWDKVMPLVDYVNLMSYDLVGGYSKVTGHHTPLYSNGTQKSSGDYGVNELLKLGVPAEKIVIGAAFYGRTWENVADIDHGLYQSGEFKSFVPHHQFEAVLNEEQGFVFYRDSISKAPYAYSTEQGEFATFDDAASIALKTQYAIDNKLGGIMFWQLTDDYADGTLLDAINKVVEGNNH